MLTTSQMGLVARSAAHADRWECAEWVERELLFEVLPESH